MTKINLTGKSATTGALTSLLGGDMSGGEKIRELEISRLIPYENQPFHEYSNAKLASLAEDIKESGVLAPVIVRPQGEDYQILAGHNRTRAAKLAGLDTVPCVIKDVDDDMAMLILVNTNLCQREKILPSEKAFAYKMLFEKGKDRGTKVDELAFSANENSRQMYRYIRLTKLTKGFLELVDNDEIPLNAGVNLSFLSEESQEMLFEFITVENIKLSLGQSEKIKGMGNFTEEELAEFFSPKTKSAKESKLAIKRAKLDKYFDEDVSDSQIEAVMLEALALFFSDKLS